MFQFPAAPILGQEFSPLLGVTYKWNGTGWLLLGSSSGGALFPPGVVLPYANANPGAPAGWLYCDGATYATALYPVLYGTIGTNYGSGGPGTFNVPDLRGRVIAGLDNMGSGAANRLTALTGFGIVPGNGGGAQQHLLTTPQLAAHAHAIQDAGHLHSIVDPTHNHTVATPADPVVLSGSTGGGNDFNAGVHQPSVLNLNPAATGITINGALTGVTVQNAGGDGAHNNVQPTMIMYYIIKT